MAGVCVSCRPSPGGGRALIFGSVLTRLPAATTDISLVSSPSTGGEDLVRLKWQGGRNSGLPEPD